MTSTTHAASLPTIWSKDIRDAISYAEVLSKLVNTSYEAELTTGRVLRIPIRGNYNTQTKTEGVANTITFQSQPGSAGVVAPGTSPGNAQEVTVSTFEYAAALLNEVVAVQSNYDERQRISRGLGYALMRGVEVSIANLAQNFSQITGTLGADPDDAVLRRSWQYLSDAGVESEASWVFGPAALAALFGNDKFTSKDFVNARSVIETATLPALYGFPSYKSNLLRAPASGQTECMLIHKEAVILLRQIMPTTKTQYLIRNLADGIVSFDLYAAVEAIWAAEAPTGDSDPTTGDYAAVLIRTG